MANVLFIKSGIRQEEMGILYLSAVLKQNEHNTLLCLPEIHDLDETFRQFKPDVVCYSVLTGSQKEYLDFNRGLKRKYRFKAVFGGGHPTFFPDFIKEEGVDQIVRGPGEQALLDIVEGRPVDGHGMQPLPPKLDDIPFPDRSLLYDRMENLRNNPMKNVITQRSCPYSCTYCYNHTYKQMYKKELKTLFDRRSAENVLEEIDGIRSQYPLEKILFIDDNFILHKDWIVDFCEKYKKNCGLPFMCSLRVNLIDDEIIGLMKEAGLEMVNFALESADINVRDKLLKRGKFSNDDVGRAIAIFNKYGIRSRMQNLIGLPMDNSYEEARSTLDFSRKNRATESWAAIFQPYPSTELAKYSVEHGYCSENVVEHCASGFYSTSGLNLKNKEKIERLQKWWYYAVEYKMDDAFLDVLMDIPLTEQDEANLMNLRFEISREKLYGIKMQARGHESGGTENLAMPEALHAVARKGNFPDFLTNMLVGLTYHHVLEAKLKQASL